MLERDDPVNWSTLKHIWTGSPKHYRWALNHPREDTEALLLGRATHCAVYEPDEFGKRYAVMPRFHGGMNDSSARAKGYAGGKQAKAEWAARFPALEALPLELYERVTGMAAALKEDTVAAPMIVGGFAEQLMYWTDAPTGIACRGRIDHVGGCLSDLKTTRTTGLRQFRSVIARFGYHAQLAYYADGLDANGVVLDAPPAIISVESSAPFDVLVLEFSDADLNAGRRVYRDALDLLSECRATDKWPGAGGGGSQFAALPEWAMPESDEPITMGGEVIL